MEGTQAISVPLFDFSIFYQDDFLSDCELLIEDQNNNLISKIRAHRIILANASSYFFDTFTSGMKEDLSKVVEIRLKYKDEIEYFPLIIEWMYKGELPVAQDTFIPLFHMARYFNVNELQEELKQYLDKNITPADVIPLIKQCYEHEYSSELQMFEQYIIKYFDDIGIPALSQELDVKTFCQIIVQMEYDIEKRIDMINQFLSSYEPDENEKSVLLDTLAPINKQMKTLVKNYNVTWLPQKFLETCK